MSNNWNIFKSNGEILGPLSPSEIREALRNGEIDPFDKVSKQGSNVRLELVEVDEIFKDQPADDSHEELVSKLYEGAVPESKEKDSVYNKNDLFYKQTAITEKKKEKARSVSKKSKKQPKKFQLIDKNKRTIGQLSASEIQSLYFRGILDSKVQVQKIGQKKRISIVKFIETYSRAKFGKHKKQSAKGALPSSKVMEQMARVSTTKYKKDKFSKYSKYIYISIFSTLIALIVGAALLFELIKKQESDHKAEEVAIAHKTISDKFKEKNITPITKNKTHKKPVKKAVIKKKSVKKRAKKRKSRHYKKPHKYKRHNYAAKSFYRPPIHKYVPKKSYNRSSNKYYAFVGRVATFSHMRFNKTQLKRCGLKCNLVFKDKSGAKITGVFFKAAYERKLMQSSGRVTIKGRVSKKGSNYIIYLQAVE